MTVLTTEKLSDTVGARCSTSTATGCSHDDALPRASASSCSTRTACSCSASCTSTTTTQVAFSRKLGRVEVVGKGDHPEIFRVTLDPAKNPVADYLQGTFDWHIDGMHRRHPDHGHAC